MKIFYIAYSIAFVTLLTACGIKNETAYVDFPFCLSDSLERNISFAEVDFKQVRSEISLSGKITPDEDKRVKVFPVVGGVVEQVGAQLGDYVRQGQKLAVIRSSDIADFQNRLVSAQADLSNAQRNIQAMLEMFRTGLATERDTVNAHNELARAKAEYTRAQQTLGIYNGDGISRQIITAPISGFIVEKNITEDMQYRAEGADPFFIISDLSEVWIMANVFESDIAKVKENYEAEINVVAFPGRVFKGKIDRIFPFLDPQSRTMMVRVRIPNADFLLKPEMFVQVIVRYDDAANVLAAIPSEGIIFDKNKNYVMVYSDRCNIETREVKPFQTTGGITYLKGGLRKGEKIITSYGLLVYDALND